LELEAFRQRPRLAARCAGQTRLKATDPEWLLDLRVIGRSPRTVRWYSQKMSWYLDSGGGVQTLEEFTAL
jgi:hypothetical protein